MRGCATPATGVDISHASRNGGRQGARETRFRTPSPSPQAQERRTNEPHRGRAVRDHANRKRGARSRQAPAAGVADGTRQVSLRTAPPGHTRTMPRVSARGLDPEPVNGSCRLRRFSRSGPAGAPPPVTRQRRHSGAREAGRDQRQGPSNSCVEGPCHVYRLVARPRRPTRRRTRGVAPTPVRSVTRRVATIGCRISTSLGSAQGSIRRNRAQARRDGSRSVRGQVLRRRV
jgi:hypothetical protein